MGVNLAEGCGAVNDAQSAAREARDMRERHDVDRLDSYRSSCVASCARWVVFCIRILVQVIDAARLSLLFRTASGVVAGLCVATLMSCSLLPSRDGLIIGYDVPLTVQLRSDSSIAEAQLTYQDACGQTQSLLIGAPLQDMIKRKTGRVFEKVLTDETGSASGPDGYVDAALGPASVDLAIHHKANKSYPAMVTLGLGFSYTAALGTPALRS